LCACIDARHDAVDEVRPIERAHEDRRIAQAQLCGDIRAHALGGGGGVSVHARLWKTFLETCELTIFRAKVVAPVADAMGFVDSEGAYFETLDELQKTWRQQSLRRDEDETKAPFEHLLFGSAQFFWSHATIKCRRWITAFAQPIDLILHQRDKRRHDDVGSLRQFRWHLVAKRFAAARRHDDQRVALLQSGFNRLLL
jgi:hypothetical protein